MVLLGPKYKSIQMNLICLSIGQLTVVGASIVKSKGAQIAFLKQYKKCQIENPCKSITRCHTHRVTQFQLMSNSSGTHCNTMSHGATQCHAWMVKMIHFKEEDCDVTQCQTVPTNVTQCHTVLHNTWMVKMTHCC